MGKVREDEFIDQEVREYVVDILSLPENFVAAGHSVRAWQIAHPVQNTLEVPEKRGYGYLAHPQ
jgi:hypothetical protein